MSLLYKINGLCFSGMGSLLFKWSHLRAAVICSFQGLTRHFTFCTSGLSPCPPPPTSRCPSHPTQCSAGKNHPLVLPTPPRHPLSLLTSLHFLTHVCLCLEATAFKKTLLCIITHLIYVFISFPLEFTAFMVIVRVRT